VRALLAQGMTGADIARELGLSKSAICYHRRRLGEEIDERCNRRYDWPAVQRYYDEGHSISDCQLHFGFARRTFTDAVKRGAIVTRPQTAPLELYLVRGRRTNRTHLKGRLLSAGLKDNRCEECGLTSWRGVPLSMALHHVNGNGDDNRLENLRLLCPNCHAQTPNFSGRNRRVQRLNSALVRAGAVPLKSDDLRVLPVVGTAL
jgi:hypothetical protein